MKVIIKIACLAACSLLLVSCGPSKRDAMKYNDKIMDKVNHLTKVHESYLNLIDGHNLDSFKIVQKQFNDEAQKSLTEIEQMKPFGGKREYADAAVNYFKTLNALVDNEGKQIVDILSMPADSLTDEDFDKISELAGRFDDEYGKVYNELEAAQIKFSKEWDFKIE